MTVDVDGAPLSEWLVRAAATPQALPDAGWIALLGATGDDLEMLCAVADQVRAEVVGDDITYVVNRNLETAAVADNPQLLADLVNEASELGATEICLQGPLPAILPAERYLELIGAITTVAPAMHLHAFRPAEVLDAADRLGSTPRAFLTAARERGLGSVPGTGARILDDEIRSALSQGADLPVAQWVELITTAHDVGLPSTATMVYGHIESSAQQVAHLHLLGEVQDRTGGFSELILMPIQPEQVPEGVAGRVRGADARETRALHAVARLLLRGRIDHLQAAWPKYGLELSAAVLAGGADDAGGILLDGQLAPDAGPEAGNSLSVPTIEALAANLARGVAQRTTLYEPLPSGG